MAMHEMEKEKNLQKMFLISGVLFVLAGLITHRLNKDSVFFYGLWG